MLRAGNADGLGNVAAQVDPLGLVIRGFLALYFIGEAETDGAPDGVAGENNLIGGFGVQQDLWIGCIGQMEPDFDANVACGRLLWKISYYGGNRKGLLGKGFCRSPDNLSIPMEPA